MSDWIQILLTILVVLAAIYLIVVLIEIIAVLALRREYQPVQRSIERAQQDVRDAGKRIDQLAPFIDSGTKEPPFGALYTQAHDLLKRANESAREAHRQLDSATRDSIPEQPLARSLLVVPVAKEISQRVSLRRGAKTAAVQLSAFNETLDRIDQIQADIKTLPKKEKEALNKVRQRSVDASAAIEAEARPKLPLAAERDKLRQVNGYIEQMGYLLADSVPTEAAVAAAHGLRLRADEQLQWLDAAMKKVAGERMDLLGALATAGDELAEYQDKIAEEAGAGMTRNQFTESATHLRSRQDQIRVMIDAGDYSSARSALDEFNAALSDTQNQFAQVQRARESILAGDAKAQQRIATLSQWIKETPPRYELDLTREALLKLQAISDQLKALAPSEDLDAMNTAGMLDANIDEIFNQATATRHDFEQQRNQFDEFSSIVNDTSVPELVSHARQVSGELAQINAAYWGDLTPERIVQSADALNARWDAEKVSLVALKESEMREVVERLKPIRENYSAVGAMHADAIKALITVDADKLQANTALTDDVFVKLLADADEIGRGSPSLAQTPALLLARASELQQALQTPAPNYKEIAVNGQRLRSDAQAFIADHAKQQQQARATLSAMHERMVGLRARLAQLNDDARIDYLSWTAPVLQRMDAWSSRDDAMQSMPLDATWVEVQAGEAITQDAEGVLENVAQLRRRLGERGDALRTSMAELNGVMTSAQTGLNALSNMGSAHWGGALLDDARKPMIAAVERMAMLEQPAQRPSPETALVAMDEAEQLTQAARAKADEHLSDIASRLNDVKDKRRALSQAIAVSQDAAQDDAELQQELHAVQLRVQELDVRSTEATSYAEALDALTQALQHAQRFAARVVGV